MADQQRYPGALGCVDELRGRGNVIGDRLLDDGRDTRRDRFESVLQMQLVGRRDDNSIRRLGRDAFGEACEASRAKPFGDLLTDRGRVDNRRQPGAALCRDMLGMAPADQAGPHHGKLHAFHSLHLRRPDLTPSSRRLASRSDPAR